MMIGHRHISDRKRYGFARACRALALPAALGLLLALAGSSARALGLGEIVQQSSLGEPFRVTIPVLVNADDLTGDELAPECFRLVSGDSERSTDLPQILFGRATLERNARGVQVVVSSNTIVNDPAMSFTVQAGCKLRIRHQYTVLLDPPVIQEPVAEASPPKAVASARPAPSRVGTATAAPRAGARASDERPVARRQSSARSVRAPTQSTAAADAASSAAASTAAARPQQENRPRLSVSRGSDERAGGASDIARGKTDEEVRAELEAETIVLQKRIAELSAQLERMQAEVREATAAREKVEHPAKAPPPAPSAPPAWEPSPWLILLLLVTLILVLTLVLVRNRRASSLWVGAGPPTVPNSGAFEPARSAADAPSPAATAGNVAAAPAARDKAEAAARMRSSVSPSATEPEASFDDDLLRYAEQSSAYSVLEREHPKVVASVIRDWGKPKVIAYLREILVAPRKTSGAFSREAVADLMLLQGIAMVRAGYRADDNPWQVEIDQGRH